jgi:hypothetical protein
LRSLWLSAVRLRARLSQERVFSLSAARFLLVNDDDLQFDLALHAAPPGVAPRCLNEVIGASIRSVFATFDGLRGVQAVHERAVGDERRGVAGRRVPWNGSFDTQKGHAFTSPAAALAGRCLEIQQDVSEGHAGKLAAAAASA